MEPNQNQSNQNELLLKTNKKHSFLKRLFIYNIFIISSSFIFILFPKFTAIIFILLLFIPLTQIVVPLIILLFSLVGLLNFLYSIIYFFFSSSNLNKFKLLPIDPNNDLLINKLKSLKKLSVIVLIFIIIAPSLALLISKGIYKTKQGITPNQKELYSEKQEKYRIQDINNRRKSQADGVKMFLSRFKKEVEWKNSNFPGYGIISNNGNCSDPESGSLFKPDFKFIPKSEYVDNKEWSDGQLAKDLSVMFPDNGSGFDRFKANNNSDARCFSNEEHYAYQRPSYLEESFPVFYCVDDTKPDVQKSNKQIKGPNCEDFDSNYVPPQTRPEPTDPTLKL